ncbi:MAG: hypothetical protein EOO24_58480, partial [Comamonadaceae bacterium]
EHRHGRTAGAVNPKAGLAVCIGRGYRDQPVFTDLCRAVRLCIQRALRLRVRVAQHELHLALQRCETLMLQSKVQFVLSHAHPKAQGALDAEPYRSAQIGEDRLIPVSAPDANGQARFRVDRASRSAVAVLEYAQESGLGRIMRAVLGQPLESVAAEVVLTAHLASVLRTMALDGRGIAWLPRTLVHEDIEARRLVLAASEEWSVPLDIRLYRDNAALGAAAEAFWDCAVRVLPGRPPTPRAA